MSDFIKQQQRTVDDDQNMQHEGDENEPDFINIKIEFVKELENETEKAIQILTEEERIMDVDIANTNTFGNTKVKCEIEDSTVNIKKEFVSHSSFIPFTPNTPDDIDIKEHYPLVHNESDKYDNKFEDENNMLKLSENLQLPVALISGLKAEERNVEAPDSPPFLNDDEEVNAFVWKISCDKCLYQCDTKEELYVHQCNGSGEKLYICDMCDFRSAKKRHLLDHKKAKHKIETIHPNKYITKTKLKGNSRKASGGKTYKCEHCDFSSEAKRKLMCHIKLKHKTVKKFPCHLCSKSFAILSKLNIHLRIHTGEKPFKCDNCDYSSRIKRSLIEHILIKHSMIKNLTCHICSKRFGSKTRLNKHLPMHTGDKPYKCDYCGFSTTERRTLINHIKGKHTMEKNYACNICPYRFVTKSNLKEHNRIHRGEEPYKCEICSFSTMAKSSLITHKKVKHTTPKTIMCHICSKEYHNTSMRRHLRMHNGKKPYKCDLCDYTCSEKYSLNRHITSIHTRVQKFSCHICPKTFGSKERLNTHICQHTGEKPFKCDHCDFSTASKYCLVGHIKAIHLKVKNFACHICPKKFDTKSKLDVHVQVHTGEKSWICDYCDYRTALRSTLKSHIKTKHTKSKKFSCNICPSKFFYNNDLIVHHRIHTGEKPYKCHYCKYRGISKSHLNTHLKTQHTSEKKFKCYMCEYKCNTNKHLIIHIRGHTGEKPYQCELCDYTCSVKSSLNRHITSTHEKGFTCNICEKQMSCKRALKEHLSLHAGEKPFKCEHCDFSTAARNNLIAHLKGVHSMGKSFPCPVCQKNFVSKSKLNRHLRVHSGEKPFKCLYCDNSFTKNDSLIRHIAKKHSLIKNFSCDICPKNVGSETLNGRLCIHVVDKLFKCDNCDFYAADNCSLVQHLKTVHSIVKVHSCHVCPKKFATSTKLRIHLRVHTGEKPYKCDYCDFRTAGKSSLNSHMRTQHTKEKNLLKS